MRFRRIYLPLFPGVFALLLKGAGMLWPSSVEYFYSRGIYSPLTKIISAVSGIFPFGLGQVTAPILLILALVWFVRSFSRGGFRKFLLALASAISIVFFIFIFSWGLNYNRLPLGEALDWQYGSVRQEDLRALSEHLVGALNESRPLIMEDEDGVAHSGMGKTGLLKQAGVGYERLSVFLPWLTVKGVNLKPSLTPRLLSYSGITGYYLFYSGEGAVNLDMSEAEVAFTAMHEEAHRRGYSREDEANFLAVMAGLSHPDSFFHYAALLNAYIYASNALYSVDANGHATIYTSLCEETKRDLQNINDFWRSYKGPLEQVADRINDTYLQFSGVSDGTQSYGRVVDLLVYAWNNDFLPLSGS